MNRYSHHKTHVQQVNKSTEYIMASNHAERQETNTFEKNPCTQVTVFCKYLCKYTYMHDMYLDHTTPTSNGLKSYFQFGVTMSLGLPI